MAETDPPLARGKGCRREAGSEESPRQNSGPTNRNRMRPLHPGELAEDSKARSVKGCSGRSGGRGGKATALTRGDLRTSRFRPTGATAMPGFSSQKSAEAIVVKGRKRAVWKRRAEHQNEVGNGTIRRHATRTELSKFWKTRGSRRGEAPGSIAGCSRWPGIRSGRLHGFAARINVFDRRGSE